MCRAAVVIIAALQRVLTCRGALAVHIWPDWRVSGHIPKYSAKLASEANRSNVPISPASSTMEVFPNPGIVDSRRAISDWSARSSIASSSVRICSRAIEDPLGVLLPHTRDLKDRRVV